jgi:hypothetical protein
VNTGIINGIIPNWLLMVFFGEKCYWQEIDLVWLSKRGIWPNKKLSIVRKASFVSPLEKAT